MRARDAPRHLRDPRVLPHQPDADLLRLADRVQPARHRPLAAQLLLRQLLRLVRGQPPARVRAEGAAVPRVRVDGGRLQLPARAQGGARPRSTAAASGGKAVFVMFDDETEQAAAAAGLEVAHPSAELRHRLDSKIVTTQLGNEAGVPSAPNMLGRADDLRGADRARRVAPASATTSWCRRRTATPARRRSSSAASATGTATPGDMVGQELKVMRRINNRAAAVEAVITRHGTIVGPLMTDLTGHPELTPHKGGWCGNDIFPEALSPEHRERARVLTQQLGDRLAGEGYRGFFEIDYLADVDTRRALPRRDQPAHQRRDVDDQRHGRRLRRHAAVPLPPARVPGRRLRDRRRRHQPPLGARRRASTSGARSSSRTPATRSSS